MAPLMFVPNDKCTSCGHLIDRPVPVDGIDRAPSTGDFVMCVECGNLMVYGPDKSLRRMDDEQRRRAMERPDVRAAVEAQRGELKAAVQEAKAADQESDR